MTLKSRIDSIIGSVTDGMNLINESIINKGGTPVENLSFSNLSNGINNLPSEQLTGNVITHTHNREVKMIKKTPDVWDGVSESQSLSGSGTENDPYLINTCSDYIHWFRNSSLYNGDSNSKQASFIEITNDLDFNNHELNLDQYSLTSLKGSLNDPFKANGVSCLVSLDGKNHSLMNINVINSGSIFPLGYFCESSGIKLYGNITIDLSTSTWIYDSSSNGNVLLNASGIGFPDFSMSGYSQCTNSESHLNIKQIGVPKGVKSVLFFSGQGQGNNLYDNNYSNEVEVGEYSIITFEIISISKSSYNYSSYTKSKFQGQSPENVNKDFDPMEISTKGVYCFSYIDDKAGISSSSTSYENKIYFDSSIPNIIIKKQIVNQDDQIVSSTDNVIPKTDQELKSDEFLNLLQQNSYKSNWIKGNDSYPCIIPKEDEYNEVEIYNGYVSNSDLDNRLKSFVPNIPYVDKINSDGIITSKDYREIFGGYESESIEKWDGSAASSFNSGSGSSNDPYIITNGSELAYLSKIVNEDTSSDGSATKDKYYRIAKDIDLNNIPFTPIGGCVNVSDVSSAKYFRGSIVISNDESGKSKFIVIRNLYINCPDKICVGLFGILNSEVGGIYFDGGEIIGRGSVGSLAGLSTKDNTVFMATGGNPKLRLSGDDIGIEEIFPDTYQSISQEDKIKIESTYNSLGGIVGSASYSGSTINMFFYGLIGFCGELHVPENRTKCSVGGIMGAVSIQGNSSQSNITIDLGLGGYSDPIIEFNGKNKDIFFGYVNKTSNIQFGGSSSILVNSGRTDNIPNMYFTKPQYVAKNKEDLSNYLNEIFNSIGTYNSISNPDLFSGYPEVGISVFGFTRITTGKLGILDKISKVEDLNNSVSLNENILSHKIKLNLSQKFVLSFKEMPQEGDIHNILIKCEGGTPIVALQSYTNWICDIKEFQLSVDNYLELNIWYIDNTYRVSYKM